MNDEKRKQLIFFLGSLFVAVIFLTSYAAFGNNNTGSSHSTSTVGLARTFYVYGTSNALVYNYASSATISLKNQSNATTTQVTKTLMRLQANGSIISYVYSSNAFQVSLSNIDAYSLQQYVSGPFANSSNVLSVSSIAYVTLPNILHLYYASQPQSIPISLKIRNYTVHLTGLKSIGSNITVNVSALVTANGSIYNNQVRIS